MKNGKVTVTTSSTHGSKGREKSDSVRVEEVLMVEELRTPPGTPEASVTLGVNAKISDSAQYGPGTWDKIPFSVEVFISVGLKCPQTEAMVERAEAKAYELAWGALEKRLPESLTKLAFNIENDYYAPLFKKKS